MELLQSQNQVKTMGGKKKLGAVTLALAATTTACSGPSSKQEHTPPPTSIAAPSTTDRPQLSGDLNATVCEGIYVKLIGPDRFRVIARPIVAPRGYPMDVETSQEGVDIELPKAVSSNPVRWYNLNGVEIPSGYRVVCSERQIFTREVIEPQEQRVWAASTVSGKPLHGPLDMRMVVNHEVTHLDYGDLTKVGLSQVVNQATAISRAGQ